MAIATNAACKPKRRKVMLTVLKIQALKPKASPYAVADGDGLYLRILPSGRKAWQFRRMFAGTRVSEQLGTYPEMTLAQARAARDALLPRYLPEDKTPEREKRPRLDAIMEEYLGWKKTKIKNWDDVRARLETHILPAFRGTYLDSILPRQVLDAIDPLVKRGEVTGCFETPKRVLGCVADLERYALKMGYVQTLRLQGLGALLPASKPSKRPSVHPDDLPDVLHRIARACMTSVFLWDATLTGFYTLLRPIEYSSMRWEWIDLEDEIITVPAETMKMKIAHRVPISRQLKALLEGRPRVSEFVFPSPRAPSRPFVQENLDKLFRDKAGLRGIFVPHGIRSAGRTWMAEHDVPDAVAELCLAHVVGTAVQRAYNRTDLLDKRREAMQRWCDYVDGCVARGSGL